MHNSSNYLISYIYCQYHFDVTTLSFGLLLSYDALEVPGYCIQLTVMWLRVSFSPPLSQHPFCNKRNNNDKRKNTIEFFKHICCFCVSNGNSESHFLQSNYKNHLCEPTWLYFDTVWHTSTTPDVHTMASYCGMA